SVNCRYNAANRRDILESRGLSARAVGEAVAGAARPPRVWLHASPATIYAPRHDRAHDAHAGGPGGEEPGAPRAWRVGRAGARAGRLSIDVAGAWERAFDEALAPRTRKVLLRSAMTLSPDAGGIFDTLVGLVRRGLGGSAGGGRQFMSWIHYEDFVAAVRWLI